jgi:hypothetical protein
MPEPTIQPAGRLFYTVIGFSSVKARNKGQKLFLADAGFFCKLIVTHTGIGILHPNDPMKDIFSVLPLIQRQIIFFQFSRHRRQYNTVDPLPEHGEHTDSFR